MFKEAIECYNNWVRHENGQLEICRQGKNQLQTIDITAFLPLSNFISNMAGRENAGAIFNAIFELADAQNRFLDAIGSKAEVKIVPISAVKIADLVLVSDFENMAISRGKVKKEDIKYDFKTLEQDVIYYCVLAKNQLKLDGYEALMVLRADQNEEMNYKDDKFDVQWYQTNLESDFKKELDPKTHHLQEHLHGLSNQATLLLLDAIKFACGKVIQECREFPIRKNILPDRSFADYLLRVPEREVFIENNISDLLLKYLESLLLFVSEKLESGETEFSALPYVMKQKLNDEQKECIAAAVMSFPSTEDRLDVVVLVWSILVHAKKVLTIKLGVQTLVQAGILNLC